ncbi:uncharacterized protein LOC143021761 [Oratosquilla oratoria]|uniref:uncharacterized protein LOC143021761 n=1 Tax=Oratosquilla oratoria TaxID=337810 RepID=UPI003F76A8D7
MVYKDEVCMWFKDNEPHRRIELLCGLLNMCLPFELRFIGTCVEDLGKRDFHNFGEAEFKANTTVELDTLLASGALDDRTRSKLVVFIALLKSDNRACSRILFKILTEAQRTPNPPRNYINEMLLIYTMVLHHPAFTFDQKQEIAELLQRVQHLETQLLEEEKDILEPYVDTCGAAPEGCDSGLSVGTEPEGDASTDVSSTTTTTMLPLGQQERSGGEGGQLEGPLEAGQVSVCEEGSCRTHNHNHHQHQPNRPVQPQVSSQGYKNVRDHSASGTRGFSNNTKEPPPYLSKDQVVPPASGGGGTGQAVVTGHCPTSSSSASSSSSSTSSSTSSSSTSSVITPTSSDSSLIISCASSTTLVSTTLSSVRPPAVSCCSSSMLPICSPVTAQQKEVLPETSVPSQTTSPVQLPLPPCSTCPSTEPATSHHNGQNHHQHHPSQHHHHHHHHHHPRHRLSQGNNAFPRNRSGTSSPASCKDPAGTTSLQNGSGGSSGSSNSKSQCAGAPSKVFAGSSLARWTSERIVSLLSV